MYIVNIYICMYELQKLNRFLEVAFDEGLISDGFVATNLTKVYLQAVCYLHDYIVLIGESCVGP